MRSKLEASNIRLWTLLTTDYGQKERRRDPVQKHLRDATYQSVGVADIIAVKYLSIRLIIIYKLQKGVLYGSMMGRPHVTLRRFVFGYANGKTNGEQ